MNASRVGLYLAARPGGGVFQYNCAMLAALAALADEGIEPIVGYSSEEWAPILARYAVTPYFIPPCRWSQVLSAVWFRLRLPDQGWHVVSRWIDPFSRAFVRARCTLWIFPSEDAWSYRLPVRALATVHDLMHRYESRFPEAASKAIFRQRDENYRAMCRSVAGVLVDSEMGKSQTVACYEVDPRRIHVLPFIPPDYIYAPSVSVDFDARYRLPKKFIFYPAQFWAHKNHLGLVRAAALLVSELTDLHVVFVGAKKNGYDPCVAAVREQGLTDHISFLGYVPDEDMPELYRRARAMVMPTFYGPTNIPPLEGFVMGCPVAVSNVYGMPEQVGDAALTFDPNRPRDIADTIRRLWLDDALCDALAARGKLRSEGWGKPQFARRLGDIVRTVLHGFLS